LKLLEEEQDRLKERLETLSALRLKLEQDLIKQKDEIKREQITAHINDLNKETQTIDDKINLNEKRKTFLLNGQSLSKIQKEYNRIVQRQKGFFLFINYENSEPSS
jgi:hypothetical protein